MRLNGLKKVETRTIVEQIMESIVDAIAKGQYKVGEKLPSEYDLIKELGVSRNSIREAMKILHTMGVVSVRRGDGTYVCSQFDPSVMDTLIYGMIFDLTDKSELVEFRQSLDEMILSLAVTKATDDDIQYLENNIKNFKKCLKVDDYECAAELDFDFHMRLCEATYNTFMIRISRTVYRLYFNSIATNIIEEKMYANADSHHTQMLDCIKSRESGVVKEVIAESLKSWKQKV